MNSLVLSNNFLTSKNTLDDFIKNSRNYPSITQQETVELYKKYEDTKDNSHLYPVLLSNLKSVVNMAAFYKKKTFNSMISLFDLIQSGCIGLLKAIELYDYTKNDNFSAYSSSHIRGAIFDYLKDNSAFFKLTTKPEFRVFSNYSKINKKIGNKNYLSQTDYSDLCNELDVTKSDIDNVIGKMNSRYVDNYKTEDGETLDIFDMLSNTNNDDPLDILLYEEYENLIDVIHENLHKLNERELDLITGRYLTDKKVQFKYYAEKYNISIERVRQLEVSAINKLKNSIKI